MLRWSLGTSMPTVVLPGNRRHDAHAGHRQGDRQVVGQAHDLRDPQPGLELDLELGDHRAGIDLDDADLVAEIEQRPLQQHGPGVDLGLVLLDRERTSPARASRSAAARTASRAEPGPGGEIAVADATRLRGCRSPASESLRGAGRALVDAESAGCNEAAAVAAGAGAKLAVDPSRPDRHAPSTVAPAR